MMISCCDMMFLKYYSSSLGWNCLRSVCDYLIAGLHVDPSLEREEKNNPVQSLVERYIQLSAVIYVDEIIPYQTEDDLNNILLTFPIAIRIIGEEYRDANFTGKNLDMKIHYILCRHIGHI